MKKRKYSETERDEIIRTFKNRTISVREFAKQYGVSTTSVYAWMKDPVTNLNTEPHELAYHQLKMRLDSAEEQLKIIKSCRFFAEVPLRTRIEEMKRLAETHSVHILSAALDVARGTYYNDILRAKGENAWFNVRKRELTPIVREAFDESHGAFGAEQIQKALKLKGINTDVRTVAKIMVACGIESNRNSVAKAYWNARRSRKNELKEREAAFTAEKPNELWVCDVTEFKYGKDHLKIYLCVIIDVFARKVIAYKFGKFNNTHLVKETFLMAYNERMPDDGLIFHSDRGSPNISRRMYDCLKRRHVVQSLSRPHVPQDNAVVESFFRTLKAEIYYPRTYANLDQLILEVSAYIEEYNAIRPHSFNGGLPPNKTEAEYWAKHPANKDVSAETSGFDSAQATDIVQ